MSPLLCPEIQLVPLLVQSMDEDWYVDTRKVACCTMDAFIRLCGSQMSDELRRSIYPELNKRMDDSSNEVRVATAASMASFARHALPEAYCDTNSGCGCCSFYSKSCAHVVSAYCVHLYEINSKQSSCALGCHELSVLAAYLIHNMQLLQYAKARSILLLGPV